MKQALLSRKEVKARLQVSDYVLKRLLIQSGCTAILERPAQRLFPIKAWQPLFTYYGAPELAN
jgi:hypothetical protein